MNKYTKIKEELAARLTSSDNDMIEIVMKKSGDVVIIIADGPADDPETGYLLKGYKLQKIYAIGMDALAMEIMNYDRTVAGQQHLADKLYAFKRERIDTGMATDSERCQYADAFYGLFGYDPFANAA